MPPLLLDIVPFYMKNEVQTREMQDFYEEIVLFKKGEASFMLILWRILRQGWELREDIVSEKGVKHEKIEIAKNLADVLDNLRLR